MPKNPPRSIFPGLQKIFDKHITGKEPWVKDSTFIIDILKLSDRYHSAKAAGLNMEEIAAQGNPYPRENGYVQLGQKDRRYLG